MLSLKCVYNTSQSHTQSPITFNDYAINTLPQIECNVLLDEFLISIWHGPGSGATAVEIYRPGGLQMSENRTELFHCMWRKEAVLQEFNDAFINQLYNGKEIIMSTTTNETTLSYQLSNA